MKNFIRYKLKTVKKIYQKHGFYVTIKIILKFILIKLGIKKDELSSLFKYEDVIKADWVNNPYTPPSLSKGEGPFTISWVLPPVSGGSGGHNTIFRFVRHLESRGHTCRLYIYDAMRGQTKEVAESILEEDFPPMEAEVYDFDCDMEECDAIFATGAETAYPVFNVDMPQAKKFYFVQDFEPAFYGIGSESVLAENTYKFGFYGITAGKWLTKKVQEDYDMDADYFDFGSDPDQYIYSGQEKKKQVAFYARPVTERRAFALGVMALDLFKQKHPEYEIVMFGWDVASYDLPFDFKSLGIITPDELNELYTESEACLVLSLTNMSLLPLEVLSGGCIPVVNDGENNRLVSNNEYIEYTANSPQDLARGLANVAERDDLAEYAQQASGSVQHLRWADAGDKVNDILTRELNK